MYITKNTYQAFDEVKDEILEELHDYFKNIYYMKCLNSSLGPTFPGTTSQERITLLNLFYLNAFNCLLTKENVDLKAIKAAITKLIELQNQNYKTNNDIFSKILFVCGMIKEHYNLNLAGIPENILSHIKNNLDQHFEGLKEWNNA